MNESSEKSCTRFSREDAEEKAALYALDSLSVDEARDFEAHQAAGCDFCSSEVLAQRELLLLIGDNISRPTRPPPSLRERLLSRVSKDCELMISGIHIVRSADGAWSPTGVPGVSVKMLAFDESRRVSTMLVRMEPGCSYPAHHHSTTEECYVLEGDLCLGDETLVAGDYQRAESGSDHAEQFTRGGCLLLVTAAAEDEMI